MAKNEVDLMTLTPEQRDARLALDVERLLRFGRKHKLIKDLDVLVARNTLLDLLALAAPSEAKPPKEDPETPAALLDEMVELAARKELFDGAVNQYRINFETRLMGALMPRESEVCKKFKKLYQKQGAKAATDWFYQLCVDTNYIRTAQIAKNIQWNTATPYGELEITINLTKPEKDPKTIALEPAEERRKKDADKRLVAGVIGAYGAPEERMCENYRRYVREYPLIGQALRSMAAEGTPALAHCVNGKDLSLIHI